MKEILDVLKKLTRQENGHKRKYEWSIYFLIKIYGDGSGRIVKNRFHRTEIDEITLITFNDFEEEKEEILLVCKNLLDKK